MTIIEQKWYFCFDPGSKTAKLFLYNRKQEEEEKQRERIHDEDEFNFQSRD